jgi:hypothetical protein
VHDEAWDELLAATPAGWFVGRPSFHHERDEWAMFAFDPRERPRNGRRRHEWTAVGQTEEHVIRSMAYCLRELSAGKAPK